ncbi:MAG: protein-export membrane protein SecD [Candidatus Doudnabacteria bacterium RIFCSPHIGHO2_01_52_17]|uniref:Protein translocase subunit SecD n=1 Tax=Candidatus Doudnabacteria bacterium RIFCSPHIGHO2_01_52_17 TaxID=1817820 RepID=A0A1F5NF32_9BACT|nr:MAG: protein-export membrane protein SecD [Candidatus Doudnabacteria bacterium RIFCSPHIGHO2_01_52_17]
MKLRLSLGILGIVVLSVLSAFVVFDQLGLVKISKVFPFRLGLDLQGGTHLVYEGNLSDIASGDRDDAMDSVRGVIERRVNAFGVAEPVVQRSGDNRLIVELPGVKDINEAVRQIGLTPFLDFREENPEYIAPEDPTEVDFNQFYRPTGLSGKHLERAEIVFDPNNNTPQISLHFDDEGKDLFAQITERNVGQTLAIFLDGVPISAPVVQQQITAGQAVITGKFTIEEARELMQRLNSGALPVPIKLLEQENIGPSLGAQSIEKSVVAGILGFLSIVVFMLVYYRLPGLIASLALVVYVFLVLAIFKLLSVTLTLPGIAGFILSVGMAVDANILIFERTIEEVRRGLPLEKALAEGFRRAWLSIRDSNISSLITCLILFWFGTSIIRGFALTLGIGIVLSMFTAIVVSRTFLRALMNYDLTRHPVLYGHKGAGDV